MGLSDRSPILIDGAPSRRMPSPCRAKTGDNRRAIDAAWYLRGIVIDRRGRATCLVDPESLRRRRPICDVAASCDDALANLPRPHLACGGDICISMNRALETHHARWLARDPLAPVPGGVSTELNP